MLSCTNTLPANSAKQSRLCLRFEFYWKLEAVTEVNGYFIIFMVAVHHQQRRISYMDWRDGQIDDSNSAGMAVKRQDRDVSGKELEECTCLQVY